MGMKKRTVFLLGYSAIVGVITGGFWITNQDIVQAALTALVWLIGLGLGAQVGDSVQRAALYRPELDKKE